MSKLKVCVAGATGWAGGQVAKALFESTQFELTSAIARKSAGKDLSEVLAGARKGITITTTLDDALRTGFDILIDYTKPDSVKDRAFQAIAAGKRVVIGTSGLTAEDFEELNAVAKAQNVGVFAAGNFSITAALAKHFAILAAKHLPSWEIIDYAHADKVDAPSGTTRELAERLGEVRKSKLARELRETTGQLEARGATIGGTQVHSIRLPSYVIGFETIFGLPNERLTLRHDAGPGAEPYVAGTLLAAEKVMTFTGLVRGLDTLLF